MLYVGVDAHKATSHITIMDSTGKILQRTQVPTSLGGLRDALGSYDEPMQAVVEASHSWGPVYDWLDELTDDVVLAHPAKVGRSRTPGSRATRSTPRPSPTSYAPP